MVGKTTLPTHLHRYFWDCRPEELDVAANKAQILTRLLDYGDSAAVRWALATYGKEGIREFLLSRGYKTLSRKTIAFWQAFLELEDAECLRTSFLQRSSPFWNV